MFYVAICLDKPGSQQLRLGNRAAHLDYLRAHADAIKTCGPFVEDDGTTMVGSLLVIDAPDRAAVETILAKDPYRRAGLFATTEVRPWRWVVGAPSR